MGTLKHHLVAAVALASTCHGQSNDTRFWWEKPWSNFQTNLRDVDWDMDSEATADFIIGQGANGWLMNAGGGLAQYPSKLDFHTVNPLLVNRPGGDLFGDNVAAARKRGIHPLARVDFGKITKNLADAHPEWLYVSPDGQNQLHEGGTVSACPSGEWYQNRTFDILAEITENYDIDGVFNNYATYNEGDYTGRRWGVCQCNPCKARWAGRPNATGRPLPFNSTSPDYPEWSVWSLGNILDYMTRVQNFMLERKPSLALLEIRDTGTIKFFEANIDIHTMAWHHLTGELVSKAKSHRPDKPVLMNCVAFIDLPWRFASQTSYFYGQYHIQAIARGAIPSTYVIGVPDKLPYTNLDIAARIKHFYMEHLDVYNGMRPSARIGLILPYQAGVNIEPVNNEYKGFYKALQELHIPFDVIPQDNLAEMNQTGVLSHYDMIIAGNLGRIQDTQARILDDWAARKGNSFVVTGAVGINTNTNATNSTQMRSLPVTRQREWRNGAQLRSLYFAPEQNRTQDNYYTYPLLAILGGYGLYDWTNSSRGLWKQLDYGIYGLPDYIRGNRQIDERGAGIHRYGSGTTAFIPWTVGQGYFEMGLVEHRDFIEMTLKEAGIEQLTPFEFKGLAEQVEVTLNVNARNETVLHLINQSGFKYMNMGPHLPIPASSFRVTPGTGSGTVTARSVVLNATLEVVDGWFQVPGLDLFDVIVIEGM